jgi:hypothetical protein
MLPDPAGESAWIEQIVAEGQDTITDAVAEAMDGRRPRLAARLLAYLDEDSDEPEVVARARRAASMLLLPGGSAFEAEQELELAWALFRRRARQRVRERLRRSIRGDYRR